MHPFFGFRNTHFFEPFYPDSPRFFPFYLVGAIFSLSALVYLGFGLPPPTPSWGELLSQAQEFRSAWWLVTYPTATLILVILLGVFIGEGVRAAFDPRVNSRFES